MCLCIYRHLYIFSFNAYATGKKSSAKRCSEACVVFKKLAVLKNKHTRDINGRIEEISGFIVQLFNEAYETEKQGKPLATMRKKINGMRSYIKETDYLIGDYLKELNESYPQDLYEWFSKEAIMMREIVKGLLLELENFFNFKNNI